MTNEFDENVFVASVGRLVLATTDVAWRAKALRAECDRLREQVAGLETDLAFARAEIVSMRALRDAGENRP